MRVRQTEVIQNLAQKHRVLTDGRDMTRRVRTAVIGQIHRHHIKALG